MKKLYSEEDLGILNQIYDCLTNDGVVEYEDNKGNPAVGEMTFNDLVTNKDLTRFIPDTVTYVIREALEPALLVVPNCFTPIRMDFGQRVEIGSMGAVEPRKIPVGVEYPQVMWNYGAGDMVALTIEKYGCQIMVPDEVIDLNLFDVFGLFLRAVGRGLGRMQEQQGVQMLDAMGTILFDNAVPTGSQYGVCTGRDRTGSQNGSMTANDVFDMYAWLVMRGFTPDTLIMNPLAWRMFMTDTEMREVVLKGMTLASRRMPAGAAAAGWGTSHNKRGIVTSATGTATAAAAGQGPPSTTGKTGANPWVSTLNPLGATFNIEPSYLPSPLKVLVTPYNRYTPGSQVGEAGRSDIVMLDSENCGILATNGRGVETMEFKKPEQDIQAIKVRQFWGMQALEQGKSVGVAKDIVIARNYDFTNVNYVTLTGLDHTTAISNSGVSVD